MARLMQADVRFLIAQGYEPLEYEDEVNQWLTGADDPLVHRRIVEMMEADVRWAIEVRQAWLRHFWYIYPFIALMIWAIIRYYRYWIGRLEEQKK